MRLLDEIAVHTGLGAYDAQRIIMNAPARYKQFFIKKRNGGLRLIAQPSRELKVLQRFVLSEILASLPVHQSAMAYVTGRSIRNNAEVHRANDVILKLDFENFFPSILVRDWKLFAARHAQDWLPDNDLLINILFWGGGKNKTKPKCLSIGAPTSPTISNLIMLELDKIIFAEATRKKLAYTRYADDITISGPNVDSVVELEAFIRSTIKSCKSPQLAINEAKRGIYTKGRRRMVTGLILTPAGTVSIGRDRKRKISALLHKSSLGQIGVADLDYLKGMLGFSIANEPEFVSRMREKYGAAVIDAVLAHVPANKSI